MFGYLKKSFPTRVLGAFALVTSICATSVTLASPIAVEVQFDLADFRFSNTAVDEYGLLNSTFLFRADFADGTTYTSGAGAQPIAVATSHSFTVSGASVAASNGTYSDPLGVAFFPNVGGFFDPFGDSTSIPGFLTIIRFDSTAQSGINVGDLLEMSHLLNQDFAATLGQFVGADVSATQSGLFSNFDAAEFSVRVFDPSVSSDVPESGTLALIGLGLAMLGFGKRRNKA